MRHNPGSVTVWAVAGQTLPEYSSAGTFHLILQFNLNPSDLEFQLPGTHLDERGVVLERTWTCDAHQSVVGLQVLEVIFPYINRQGS